ncbi:DUF421 domain-containing protein [Spirosoma luteolum]
MKDTPVDAFDWQRMLIQDLPWTFLGEVAFRTVFMFVVLLTALTVSGKREVRQLSIYELVLLIGLGSAAGDPMFYDDVPLSAAVVVFVVMMGCYKLVTFISDRNPRIRETLEGKPVYVIENGCVLVNNFDREDLGIDELFSDLRVAGIDQLGQVRIAILEANGQLSVFQQPDDAIRPGLPILPRELSKSTVHIQEPGQYACLTCGTVDTIEVPTPEHRCPTCRANRWVKATGPRQA